MVGALLAAKNWEEEDFTLGSGVTSVQTVHPVGLAGEGVKRWATSLLSF